ncbi:purine-nucleoside phosphorylase [Erysipelothrix inopinata]|uniref:Purine nucleoside phosphorylase n=1 Tax=Erysipelothrix inopinata TaxID=225084 RepID=A0A7G9RZE5_9FIRM|nr:purine-nucleoside phosphorylase [Erysipelothrix inopinata]QNN60970.1 purine-nucleoside phosphorylase [Erysipelothrix inopinata]
MFYDNVVASAEYIQSNTSIKPRIGIILGSGLGSLVDRIENKEIIPYDSIPQFPKSSLEGHAGNLVFGTIGDQNVMVMQGRFHYYEGFAMKEVTYPIYVMKMMGVESMIVTNACGGINTDFKPGDLMIIDDFINSVSTNPLVGSNDERFGPRFPDMSEPYSTELRDHAKEIAKDLNIEYKEGVYTFFQGPYYETRAEIRMYGKNGSDAIGMSTVPETIVANYLGLKVLGISCITNMATGLRDGKHSHAEVVAIANKASEDLCNWVEALIKDWK